LLGHSANHQNILYLLLLRKYSPAATLYVIQDAESSYFANIRPGWDDLKSCLITANGLRRYKVYVCTMAGTYYALEAWRLLDPEGRLISSEEISQRLICVRRGKI
jgi:RNA polymerase II C-terminal domain phosphatase-like 1/2